MNNAFVSQKNTWWTKNSEGLREQKYKMIKDQGYARAHRKFSERGVSRLCESYQNWSNLCFTFSILRGIFIAAQLIIPCDKCVRLQFCCAAIKAPHSKAKSRLMNGLNLLCLPKDGARVGEKKMFTRIRPIWRRQENSLMQPFSDQMIEYLESVCIDYEQSINPSCFPSTILMLGRTKRKCKQSFLTRKDRRIFYLIFEVVQDHK